MYRAHESKLRGALRQNFKREVYYKTDIKLRINYFTGTRNLISSICNNGENGRLPRGKTDISLCSK